MNPSERAQYDQDHRRSDEHLDRLIAAYRATRDSGVDDADAAEVFFDSAHRVMRPAQMMSALWTAILRLERVEARAL